MKRFISSVVFAATMFASATGFAAEKTVTLAVSNMYCASCPYIVKKALTGIAGVKKAEVSFQNKTAVVTFDDSLTNVPVMTEATKNAGYPSRAVR